MFNERNQRIEKAGPSEPALILGLNGAPQAGDTFNVLETDQEAREIANRREQLQRELGLRTQKMLTLDDIGRRIAVGNFQELNVIVKGDVDGSVEALSDSLIRLSTEEIQVNVIHKLSVRSPNRMSYWLPLLMRLSSDSRCARHCLHAAWQRKRELKSVCTRLSMMRSKK